MSSIGGLSSGKKMREVEKNAEISTELKEGAPRTNVLEGGKSTNHWLGVLHRGGGEGRSGRASGVGGMFNSIGAGGSVSA